MGKIEDNSEVLSEGDYFSEKVMEEFKRADELKRVQTENLERKIASKALQVLRYILRKHGSIDEKTLGTRFSTEERKATEQLIDLGWLEEEEGVWRSPSFQGFFLFSTILLITLVFSITSTAINSPIFITLRSASLLLLPMNLLALVLLLFMGGFYSHRFKVIKMPEKTLKLLLKWSKTTGNSLKYYGAMEGEETEKIRSKIFERLHNKLPPEDTKTE